MRVLIACDVDTSGEGNPYVFQLIQALERHPHVDGVQHGTGWLRTNRVDFDLLHIQWPEALTGWREPTRERLSTLHEQLERWSSRARIVVTAHNEYPHGRDTGRFRELYRLVYRHADGLIHLGHRSRAVILDRYEEELRDLPHAVIPHGAYSWFPDTVSRLEARERLGISQDSNLVLCFGRVRHREEIRLLLRGFRSADLPRKRLLVAGRLEPASMKRMGYLPARIPFWIGTRVRLVDRRIPASRVQLYLNAANVLIVPRVRELNSGNVALGLTFGVVTVGRRGGVIGEMLDETGNPTFDPKSASSVGKAIEEAVDLGPPKGRENRRYAREHLDWDDLGDAHVEFYQSLSTRGNPERIRNISES